MIIHSIFSRRRKDGKINERWERGLERFCRGIYLWIGLKKRWVGILQIKSKGKKKSNSGKSRCEIVFCVQGTESGLVEMEVTVDKEGEGGREDPMRAEAC